MQKGKKNLNYRFTSSPDEILINDFKTNPTLCGDIAKMLNKSFIRDRNIVFTNNTDDFLCILIEDGSFIWNYPIIYT